MKRILKYIKDLWNNQAYRDVISHSPGAPILIILLMVGCTKTFQPVIDSDMIITEARRPPQGPKAAIVYIKTDGYYLNDPVFYTGDTLLQPYTGPTSRIMYWLNEAYTHWDVVFTTNERLYNKSRNKLRSTLVLTPTSFRPGVSGLANVGSIYVDDAKSFVFTSTLFNDPDMIGKIAVHEYGHMIGMYHARAYDTACNITNFNIYGAWMGQPSQHPNPYWVIHTLCQPRNDTAFISTVIKRQG